MTVLEYLRTLNRHKEEITLFDIYKHFDEVCSILIVTRDFKHLRRIALDIVQSHKNAHYSIISNKIVNRNCYIFLIENEKGDEYVRGMRPDYICEAS